MALPHQGFCLCQRKSVEAVAEAYDTASMAMHPRQAAWQQIQLLQSAEAGLAAAQVTLNSAKAHYGVEGDAQKRVLEKMREMLGSQASEGQLLTGQALPKWSSELLRMLVQWAKRCDVSPCACPLTGWLRSRAAVVALSCTCFCRHAC